MLEGSPAIQQQSGGAVPTCLLVVFPCSTRLLDSTKPLSANLSSVLLMQQLAMLSCVFQQEFFSLLLIHRLIDHIYGKSFCFDVARARWLFNLTLNVLRSFKKTSKPATRSSSVRDGQIAWHLAAVAVSSPCVCLWELSALGGSAPLLVHSQDHP